MLAFPRCATYLPGGRHLASCRLRADANAANIVQPHIHSDLLNNRDVYFSVKKFHIWTPGYFASVRCHIWRCSHFSQWSVIEEGGADIHSAHFFRWCSSSWHSLSDSITNDLTQFNTDITAFAISSPSWIHVFHYSANYSLFLRDWVEVRNKCKWEMITAAFDRERPFSYFDRTVSKGK